MTPLFDRHGAVRSHGKCVFELIAVRVESLKCTEAIRSSVRRYAGIRSDAMAHVSFTEARRGLDEAAIIALRRTIRGAVLQPHDASYAQARSIWNGMITRAPALIAQPTGTA